jgi:hypothetical protein
VNLDGFAPRFMEWLLEQSAETRADLESAWTNADAAPGHRNEHYARRAAVIALAKERGFSP